MIFGWLCPLLISRTLEGFLKLLAVGAHLLQIRMSFALSLRLLEVLRLLVGSLCPSVHMSH